MDGQGAMSKSSGIQEKTFIVESDVALRAEQKRPREATVALKRGKGGRREQGGTVCKVTEQPSRRHPTSLHLIFMLFSNFVAMAVASWSCTGDLLCLNVHVSSPFNDSMLKQK